MLRNTNRMLRFTLPLVAVKAVQADFSGLYSFSTLANPAWALAHCSFQSQARLYSTLQNFDDFVWSVGPALNGVPGAVSFQSFNYPTLFLAPAYNDPDAPTRLGLVAGPDVDDASFIIVAGLDGPNGTISVQSLSKNTQLAGLYMSMGGSLTGACADGSQNGIALDVILDDGLMPLAATWAPSSMTPPMPSNVTIFANASISKINANYLGCHADMGASALPSRTARSGSSAVRYRLHGACPARCSHRIVRFIPHAHAPSTPCRLRARASHALLQHDRRRCL